MPEEIPNFKKQEKVGISISVDKENLEKLKEFLDKNFPKLPLSVAFDTWLEEFVERMPRIEESMKKEQTKKEGEKEK